MQATLSGTPFAQAIHSWSCVSTSPLIWRLVRTREYNCRGKVAGAGRGGVSCTLITLSAAHGSGASHHGFVDGWTGEKRESTTYVTQKECSMMLKKHYLGCLAHASYLIGDEATGTAVVVDPQRDIDQYLQDAERYGLHV